MKYRIIYIMYDIKSNIEIVYCWELEDSCSMELNAICDYIGSQRLRDYFGSFLLIRKDFFEAFMYIFSYIFSFLVEFWFLYCISFWYCNLCRFLVVLLICFEWLMLYY